MPKILIVDDSEILRLQLREFLEKSGNVVIDAPDGFAGLKKAESEKSFDIIISDFNMPNMDGLTMCKKIKEIPSYEKTPIFMLTTESSPELKAIGKSVGVMLWIIKPFTEEKVLLAINKIMGK